MIRVTIDPDFSCHHVDTGKSWLCMEIWNDGALDVELELPHTTFLLTLEELRYLVSACEKARKAGKKRNP
jgi:hypothetical protein